MKFTNDVAKRCEDMLHNFADRNHINMSIKHDHTAGISNVEIIDYRYLRPIETYVIIWDEARNLSEACASIFVDLTRKLNLDGYDTAAFKIKNVVFNDPATIILWEDGTKTVVKCQEGDTYSKETGMALCIAKKALGNQGNFNEVFKKWIPEEDKGLVFSIDMPSTSAKGLVKIMEEQLDRMFKDYQKGLRGLEV